MLMSVWSDHLAIYICLYDTIEKAVSGKQQQILVAYRKQRGKTSVYVKNIPKSHENKL